MNDGTFDDDRAECPAPQPLLTANHIEAARKPPSKFYNASSSMTGWRAPEVVPTASSSAEVSQ
jgi:hypothetical protein